MSENWRTRCRCGAKLAYSSEDIGTGRPAEGADYWCSDPQPDTGPHDHGVVMYYNEVPKMLGLQRP